MGFITLHEMEAFDIVIHKNYREVGLDIVNGQQLGALNAYWNVWQPNLGLGSTMGFGHLQCIWLLFYPAQYGSRERVEGTHRGCKGEISKKTRKTITAWKSKVQHISYF